MYTIERKTSGYLLSFSGFMDINEIDKWIEDSIKALQTAPPSFGVIVDMRSLKPLPQAAQNRMVEGQQHYKDKGMTRSAVILADAITTAQFKRLAQMSGIYAHERYIDASRTPNWSAIAKEWVVNAVDPDK